MDNFNNGLDITFDDLIDVDASLEAPSQGQGQEQSGGVLLPPSFSENQGQDAASEATEGVEGLSAEELEDLYLLWREVNASPATEPEVPTGLAPLPAPREPWNQSQGVEGEDVSGNDAQAGPSGVAPPSVYPQAHHQSQQTLSGHGAQYGSPGFPLLPADLVARDQREGMSTVHFGGQQGNFAPPASSARAQSAPTAFPPPPVHHQAYIQSQQHGSGNGAQVVATGSALPQVGFSDLAQRQGYVPAASMVDASYFGMQQADLPPPPQFSGQFVPVAPSGLAPSSAGSPTWDQGTAIARVDSGVDAAHLGGQQADLPPRFSALPPPPTPTGVSPPFAGPSTWNQRVEPSRVNARVNDVHSPAQQANLAAALSANPAQATLAHRPLQSLPPAHQYGGQVAMVPGVPLAPTPAPVPAPAPGPAPPALNPFLPPAPVAPRRTGRGKGNPHGPQNFPCAQCDFATGTKQKLVSHERIHTNPSHFCPVNGCGKPFWSAKDLKRHVDTHFPERAQKYVCGECGKEDKRRDNHSRHVETCKKKRKRKSDEEGEGEGGDGGS